MTEYERTQRDNHRATLKWQLKNEAEGTRLAVTALEDASRLGKQTTEQLSRLSRQLEALLSVVEMLGAAEPTGKNSDGPAHAVPLSPLARTGRLAEVQSVSSIDQSMLLRGIADFT